MQSRRSIILTSLLMGSFYATGAQGADTLPKSGELLARHLDAIGTAETRSSTKTRVAQGTATYRLAVGGGGRAEGKTGIVSEGHKFRFMMKFPAGDYRGENVVFNGKTMGMAFSNSNQTRSPFAYFLSAQDVMIKEGLLGGTLSTAWPLFDLPARNARLTVEGLKRVDGKQVYQVRYSPARPADVQIVLYFDAETFRHVGSVYSISVGNNLDADITKSASLLPERSSLEERFSDFRTFDGMTLPTHWNLQFTRELPDGSTSIAEWDLREDQVRNNVGLDPRNFEVR
jgi:hypothetical protein